MAGHLEEIGQKIKCMVLGCTSGLMTACIPAPIKTTSNTAMESTNGPPENTKAIGNKASSTVSAA